jgi:hypothetical protein
MKRPARRFAVAALAFALTSGTAAFAQQPAQSPDAAPSASNLTTNQVDLARSVVLGSGMGRSFEALVPTFAEQIRQLYVTRPEIQKDLDTVLEQIRPEIEKRKDELITAAARTVATHLNEADLTQIDAFFKSQAGQRYVAAQPLVLDDIFNEMRQWTSQTADFALARVREEMKKKGHNDL